jgi:hypothetical protein
MKEWENVIRETNLNAIDKQLNKRRHFIVQFLLQALDPM